MGKAEEDKSFKKFVAVSQIIGVFFFLGAMYVFAFGVPNFSNVEEQAGFCHANGGNFFPPHRDTYNTGICAFSYEGYSIDYVAEKMEDGSYCFICWDSRSCSSEHGNILREQGVRC